MVGRVIPAHWRIEAKALIHSANESPEAGHGGQSGDTGVSEEFLEFPPKQRKLLKALDRKRPVAIAEVKVAVYGSQSVEDSTLDRLRSRTNRSLANQSHALEIKRKSNTLSLQPL